jgi:type I pantothenate kinase
VQTVAALAEEVRERRARTVAVTGGVAAGKSTFAAALAGALGALGVLGVPVVATDGFLFPNDELDRRGLTARKGFPESFDAAALRRFLQAFRAGGRAEAPVYSHLAYDVVAGAWKDVSGDVVIVEGLHLAHPALGVRELLDVVIHLDADDADLERWFLERFRSLRAEAAGEPAAFLHPYRDMPADVIEGMALDVWRSVNLVVLHEEVRPQVGDADVVVRFGPAHDIESIEVRAP